jgi:hypothetical protein
MELRDLLEELEKEIQAKKNVYESYINQPSLISLTSDNSIIKEFNNKNDSFFSFTCNLEKPALQVKSIQLLNANIPQAKAISFDDTELIFPYYKLKTQKNIAHNIYFTEQPNINNLYYVRLLPSYYPSNIIPNAENYGFNKTFNNYQELSDELIKSCQADLLYTNISYNKFIPNDITISYNQSENKFQMSGNNADTAWTPPNWSEGVNYSINQIVKWEEDIYYISLIDYNINYEPPSVSEAWALYTDGFTHTYLIAGYEDPNVYTLQRNINIAQNARVWDATTSYIIGDLVYYNDIVYNAIDNNVNYPPSLHPDFWENYTATLAQETNADFLYSRYGLNNIVSIPSQPYKKNKTLAKRLGFTWNGIFTWIEPNNFLPLIYVQGSSSPIFWNRLRPIPPYELLEEELGSIPIPNNNPYTQKIYIADNYCNLVYSSILNIYSNITTASTVDTQSRRNILSIVPINCGQLGITFTSNFIDNPLTKINNDIYQIRIELRNEIDEPYFISNNGIVSILLKLTY